jgi:RNA polymerase sigma factor (sigma-70 family)
MNTNNRHPDTGDLLAHADFVRAVARRMLLDDDRADDVVQQTLVAAIESAPKRRGPMRAWLAGIARNMARMMIRSESRRTKREASAVSRRPERPDNVAIRLETQRRLVEAVEALEEPFRSTIVHRYFDDLTPAEIAEREGIPAATVRTRTHRALAMLRERYDDEHGGDRRKWSVALLPLALPRGATATAAATVAVGGGLLTIKMLAAVAAVLILALAGSLIVWATGDPAPVPDSNPPPRRSVADTCSSDEAPGGSEEKKDLVEIGRAIVGVVVAPDGSPVAGAHVQIQRSPWLRLGLPDVEKGNEVVKGPATTTGPDGRFSLPVAPGGQVDLRVTATGLGTLLLRGHRAGAEVRVDFGAGATLGIRVRDEVGHAISGARVMLFTIRGPDSATLDGRATTTDDGRCAFRGISARAVGLNVEHDDYGTPGLIRQRIPPDTNAKLERDVVLTRGRRVRGRVVDADTGRPIQGALVRESPSFGQRVTTDGEGRFVFEHWTGRLFPFVWAGKETYAHARSLVPDDGDLVIRLSRGDEITGRIVDADGRPVPGALMAAVATGSGEQSVELDMDCLTTVAGADGRFLIGCVRRDMGPHLLAAVADGHGKVTLEVPPRAEGAGCIDVGDLVLPVAGPPARPIPRPPARTEMGLKVRVLDSRGLPLRMASVAIRGGPRDSTGEDGRASFRLDSSDEVMIEVTPRAPFATRRVLGPITPAGQEVEVTFENVAQIRGRILGPDDEPLSRVMINVFVAGRQGPPAQWLADAEGRFALALTTDQTVDLLVNGERPTRDYTATENPRPVTGQVTALRAPAEGVIIRCRTATTGGALAVTVRDVDGHPCAGVPVRLEGRFTGLEHARTGADGVARLTGLRDEELEVTARLEGNEGLPATAIYPVPVRVRPDAGEVTIRFRSGILLTGIVRDATGKPCPKALVRLLVGDDVVSSALTDEAGRFRLAAVPGKSHTLWANARSGHLILEDVIPGEKPLEVTLPAR